MNATLKAAIAGAVAATLGTMSAHAADSITVVSWDGAYT